MNLIETILNHADTRVVPCKTKSNVLDDFALGFKSEEMVDNSEYKELSVHKGFKILQCVKEEKKIEKTEISIKPDEYRGRIKKDFAEQFDSIRDVSFVSPFKFHYKDAACASGWKKDRSSGRSFHFLFEDPSVTIINKGGDLLRKNRFRRYSEDYRGIPMIGSATLDELKREFDFALYIQEHSLRLQGRTTFTTQPLQLNELTHFLLESGEVVPFRRYLQEARKNREVSINILYNLVRVGEDVKNPPKDKEPFEWAVDSYIEKLGPHSTYLYLINGLNARVIDSKHVSKKELKRIISKQYPEERDEKGVCEAFMKRLGEYYGIIQGLGLSYKRQSECLLIDTTLGGITMDIGDLCWGANQEAYLNGVSAAKACSFYFYQLFFPRSKESDQEFIRLFDRSFVNTMYDYMYKSNSLIKDEKHRKKTYQSKSI